MIPVTLTYGGGMEGWTRTVELHAVPRVGEQVDSDDGVYVVKHVVWTIGGDDYPEGNPIPYVVVGKP